VSYQSVKLSTLIFLEFENYHFSNEIIEKSCQMVLNHDKENIFVYSPFDKEYPESLKLIHDYPPLIFVKGNINLLNSKSVAIVGTRHPSEYGSEVAYRISMKLAENNYTITSGLALGIDTSVHKGALKAHGNTIAVLAHGLDTIAPSSNRNLANLILNNNGMLISEHEYGIKPIPAYFALRDRIQSGLSFSSIIIESKVPGGSIIQAKYTFEQKRKLYTIIHDNSSKASLDLQIEGADYIIKNYSAIPISNMDDVSKYFFERNNIINTNIQKELFE
jgi:DNA processing protein